MGRVGHHLYRFLEALAPQLVDEQRHDHGKRERRQRIKGKDHRIADDLPALGVIEKLLKILQPHPRAAPDALGNAVIPEGDLQARHGPIIKDNEIHDGRKQQQINLPVIQHPAAQTLMTHLQTRMSGAVFHGRFILSRLYFSW